MLELLQLRQCQGYLPHDHWSGASRHTEVDEQPRRYIRGLGQDGRGGSLIGGGAWVDPNHIACINPGELTDACDP